MQFLGICAVFALCASAALGQGTVSVSYDQLYDDGSESLNYVACSDGPNGLEQYGYTTLSTLPNFPNIGGAQVVTGFGSAECGTCWQLAYDSYTINVLAIDSTANGFNIALEAMNNLTNGQAVFLGRVNATATQLDASDCGLGEKPDNPN
ncbi:Cerato-platanin [Rhodofomes roseus]|uniref:Cerato-platanin n=1 Tax=Rhodofomes roseus TaxID=34475 RepID=A0A4Y9YCS2_9APHY|nr:Cerato-platanin [Rhodofomes roseus]KAH9842502.1 Cerato-platanin [Rhodofomes roseus]TFY58669.1 hypothetical protein EVJ58_g6275 [Rhodofomes roseus]